MASENKINAFHLVHDSEHFCFDAKKNLPHEDIRQPQLSKKILQSFSLGLVNSPHESAHILQTV